MKRELLLELIGMLVNSDSEKNQAVVSADSEKELIGEWVIVRCRDAGVHFGKLKSYEGREVVLSDSRRMSYWFAKQGHTLSGCAVHGIKDSSKIAAKIKTIVLPEASEIIECEEVAIKLIGGADEYQPN